MKKLDTELLILTIAVSYIMFMLEKVGAVENGILIGMAITTMFVIGKIVLIPNKFFWLQIILTNIVGILSFSYKPSITVIMILGAIFLIIKKKKKDIKLSNQIFH